MAKTPAQIKAEKEAKAKAARRAANTGSDVSLISKKKKIRTDVPLLNQPSDIDQHGFDINAGQVDPSQVDLTDPNFSFDRLQAGQLANRFMTAADYTLLDPADVQNEFGDITRSEMRKNAAMSSDLALDAIDTELQGLLNYAPTAANLQRQQVALDNTTNQAERTKMLEAADPNIRKDLESQRGRFSAYAEGRVPDSITDRQLELGIQSKAADRAAGGGFGKGSSAAMKAGQLMSAEARIGLSQYGDQALSQNIGQRTSTLMADQQYATGGSQISVMPSMSAGQAAMAIASEANAGNITARDALANKTQQGQFKAELEQDANKTNLLTSSQRDLNQAQLDMQADSTNADNDIRTQLAGKQINSSERQFNAELKTNTLISNIDRAFQAANINAGRGLEIVTTNRAVRLQIDQTNKGMVFQDIQRKRAEAFAMRQQASAISASRANAASSASAHAASLAAQQSEAALDRQFQLQQQQQALDIYNKYQGKAQSSSTAGAVGGIITKVPDILKGIGSIGSFFGKGSSAPGEGGFFSKLFGF